MSHVYVYPADCQEFTSFGLVGALTPTSCIFEEEANGISEITMQHPIDAFGRHTQLIADNLLKVDVPVRTTPEIKNGVIVTVVEQWAVRPNDTITKAQRALYKKASGSSRIAYLEGGTIVTVVDKPAEGRYKVKCTAGTGYMDPAGLIFMEDRVLADNSQSIESVQPAWSVKPQIFRIYKVERSISSISVSARHISYDLMYNLTSFKSTAATSCKAALAAIMDNCIAPHDFKAYTNLGSERAGIDWTRINPIEAMLNPDTGLTTLYSASLVRDNWELYILHDPGMNRGVTVEYGKNMTGIKYTESLEDVVTRIIPMGETDDGEPLMLDGTQWIDSPRINDYPFIRTQVLDVEDAKVGDGVTTAMARARMREAAQAVFNGGGDQSAVEMTVNFVLLGDTAEYARFKDLERLFLWDYVLVRHKLHGIDVTSRIVSVKWDCLLDRMKSMEIGSVGKTLANSGITTWQIPTGFSGAKIANGTIGNGALMDNIIAARHIQSESISADKIQAGAITTEKLAAGSVTADKIQAGAVETVTIDAVAAYIEKLTAQDIETDRLAAALAAFTVLTAGTAEFDQATVAHLVAQALNLEFGTAEQVFIRNLAVEYAQMVGATIGHLCIKASDGNYYLLDVAPDGTVSATLTTVSDGEISAGQTDGGNIILDTNITAANLNAGNILATYALINRIDAARLDVDELFAREAFVGLLRTSRIIGEKSLTMIAEDAENAATIFRQETPPWTDDGVKVNDLWIVPSLGEQYQAVDAEKADIKFYLDSEGNIHYSTGSEYAGFYVNAFDLCGDAIYIPFSDDGFWSSQVVWMLVRDMALEIYDGSEPPANASAGRLWLDRSVTPPVLRRWRGLALATDNMEGWETVNDTATIEAAQAEIQAKQAAIEADQRLVATFLRIDHDMVRIGKEGVTSEFQIDPWGAGVSINQQVFSRFEANRALFGDMEIRRPAVGGLVFDSVTETEVSSYGARV